MEHEVLIGTVKNRKQFEVNFNEKFYHIPEAVVPQNMLPVEYVALYLPVKKFGEEEGSIRYYGKVREMKKIKRNEITSIPSRNGDMSYLMFEVEEWIELEHPIVRESGGIYTKAFTSLEKFLSAKNLSDIINTERAVAKKRKNRGFSKDVFEKIEVTKDPVGVKLLAKRINKAAGIEKIRPVQITRYLLEEGYLKTEFDEKTGTENRVPTDKGTGLGIENFWEINRFYREYSKNYYSAEAQKFIISHLNDIVLININKAYKND